jgi:hypothetical protein
MQILFRAKLVYIQLVSWPDVFLTSPPRSRYCRYWLGGRIPITMRVSRQLGLDNHGAWVNSQVKMSRFPAAHGLLIIASVIHFCTSEYGRRCRCRSIRVSPECSILVSTIPRIPYTRVIPHDQWSRRARELLPASVLFRNAKYTP